MTPLQGIGLNEPQVNWRNFRKACMLAARADCTTAMITSKGEPCLFPHQITKYLEVLNEFEHDFPFIELQTNGINIYENKGDMFWDSEIKDLAMNIDSERHPSLIVDSKQNTLRGHLVDWYRLGLTTVIISIVHYERSKNHKIYTHHRQTEYIDLPSLIKTLHRYGFSIRLGCVGLNGFIDNPDELANLIEFAKQYDVEQLTYRPVNAPENPKNIDIAKWTREHFVSKEKIKEIDSWVSTNGKLLPINLVHGAKVYDVYGQNVCLSNCLTDNVELDGSLRQLIFFPDGHLRYSWEYTGAVML
jgi:molybdenum cofactor biosynthesis enzyme MoaA